MSANKHRVALLEVLLIFPAVIFMASLVMRQMPGSGLGVAAQRTVMWYAERPWTLWLLLVTLPLVVLVVGSATLLQGWDAERAPTAVRRPLTVISTNGTNIVIATLTAMAVVILVIVGLHMLAN